MADKLPLDKNDLRNPATAHLRIYVGGITDDATVESLYNHFKEYGQIDGIICNRTFGFVQFHDEASAQKAIANASDTFLHDRKISVKPAQRSGQAKREVEVVTIPQDVPPAMALSENMPGVVEPAEDVYDSYGNYVGERENYREDEYEESFTPQQNTPWTEARGGPRGRGGRGRGRGRGAPPPPFMDPPRKGGDWPERNYAPPEYPRALPVPERNDCEIIVVAKSLTEYAEYIEGRLKRLGIVVDLLFPMEDVPIGKVLGNIASRGCLYAILVSPTNYEHRSLTLTILHGLPQEHRNMPLEDALQLLSRNFQEVQRGGPGGSEAVYALLGQLADGRSLTALQYDKVIEYLRERKEQQVKIELGEPLPSNTNKTQVDLQQRILNILNEKKPVAPEPKEQQNKLLNDPSVRKALDSILQKMV